MENTVIKVEGVYKDFILPHEKNGSVKGVFTSMFSKATKKKETQHALKNISFEIKKGEFFGIVGRNGSGKSTLLKILAKIYQPTKGNTHVIGKLVPFIELGVGFNPELTGRDNVYLNGAILGFSTKEVDAMYDEIVEFAELERFMDQKLKNYSSGMQVRLAFSMAIRANADILLIDEVLAVGDADFQRKCYNYFKTLKRDGKTVVFVSHNMSAIREFCDRALLINDSEIKYIGKTPTVADKYNQLFNQHTPSEDTAVSNKRWGNGDATIVNVDIKLEGDYVITDVDLKASKQVEKIIYGVHFIAADGEEVTAMNNRMLKKNDLEQTKQGSITHIRWKVLNIFNDGKYSVTLSFIDDIGNTLDWWVDAKSFTVKRDERSTTAVLPPVTVTTRVE